MSKLCLAVFWLFVTASAPGLAVAHGGATDRAEMQRFLADVCDKQVVLLGEDDNHGGGHTLATKARLVEALIDHCGFSAVVFESPVYDFFDFQRSLDARTASPEQLADAIGGLWSTAKEFDPLLAYLYRAASERRVHVFGMDPQLGGATQLYSQERLPTDLAAVLQGTLRAECEAEFFRLSQWLYTDSSPFDHAARQRLRTCAVEVKASTAATGSTRSGQETALMADNVARFLDMSSGDAGSVRDRAMFDNFMWHRARLPANTKFILWCASIHAAKQAKAAGKIAPLGSYLHATFGDQAAAIAFSALSGNFGRPKHPAETLAAAPADSLEARTLTDSRDAWVYLDRKHLDGLAAMPARAIDYDTFESLRWSDFFDGMIVLRTEQKPDYIRSASPQQPHRRGATRPPSGAP